MSRPLYTGTLIRKKMTKEHRCAYEAFCGTKARSKKYGLHRPKFTAREFMGWWLAELIKFKGTTPTCGRIDHSLGYSWENIEMQDMADNSREAALRNKLGDHGLKRSKKVCVHSLETGAKLGEIANIRAAARFFGVSQRLVQFLVRGDYKSSKQVPFQLRGEA